MKHFNATVEGAVKPQSQRAKRAAYAVWLGASMTWVACGGVDVELSTPSEGSHEMVGSPQVQTLSTAGLSGQQMSDDEDIIDPYNPSGCAGVPYLSHYDVPYRLDETGAVNERLLLDIYAPADASSCNPAPVVIWIHGGSWRTKSKDFVIEDKRDFFVDHGYVFVAINYRLSPEPPQAGQGFVRHPDHVTDVATAIARTIENVDRLGGDPDSVIVVGFSAGAHLAALVSTDARYLAAEGHSLDELACTISADVSAYDIPLNLSTATPGDEAWTTYVNAFTANPQTWVDASPITHVDVDKNIPPHFFVRRGGSDRATNLNAYQNALLGAGVRYEQVATPQLTHNDVGHRIGTASDQQITPAMMRFIDRCLTWRVTDDGEGHAGVGDTAVVNPGAIDSITHTGDDEDDDGLTDCSVVNPDVVDDITNYGSEDDDDSDDNTSVVNPGVIDSVAAGDDDDDDDGVQGPFVSNVDAMGGLLGASSSAEFTMADAYDPTGCAGLEYDKQSDVQYRPLPASTEPNEVSMDIWAPVDPSQCEPAPVVIWVHGGGWRSGDKSTVDDKQSETFTTAGYVFVSVNYRLSPNPVDLDDNDRVMHPAHSFDVSRAIAAVHDNIATVGGDPDRIFVVGFSAGAHLTALVSTDESYLGQWGLPLNTIKCAATLDTAAFDINARLHGVLPGSERYDGFANAFGEEDQGWFDASPINHVEAGKGIPPFFITVRSGDLDRQQLAADFRTSLKSADVDVTSVVAVGYTHAQIGQTTLMLDEPHLTPKVLAWMAKCVDDTEP